MASIVGGSGAIKREISEEEPDDGPSKIKKLKTAEESSDAEDHVNEDDKTALR